MATQSLTFAASNLPTPGGLIASANVNTTLQNLINDYNLQIGTNKIADASITSAKIGANAVGSTKLDVATAGGFDLGQVGGTGDFWRMQSVLTVTPTTDGANSLVYFTLPIALTDYAHANVQATSQTSANANDYGVSVAKAYMVNATQGIVRFNGIPTGLTNVMVWGACSN